MIVMKTWIRYGELSIACAHGRLNITTLKQFQSNYGEDRAYGYALSDQTVDSFDFAHIKKEADNS